MGMKNPKLFTFLLIISFVCVSCKEDEFSPESDITISSNGPTASFDHPAVATADQPVTISFTEKSLYKDINGYRVDCEPHASINLTVSEKTIHAKSLAELLKVVESSKIVDTKVNAPKSNEIIQTFKIGGQTVNFTTAYEVYSYKNAAGEVIELPYVKVNPAHLGEVEHSVLEYGGPLEVSPVTAVRIRPVSNTRGSMLLEDLYEVVVCFVVEIETHKGISVTKQNYNFEVLYTATVERVFEYPDPTTTFDYTFRKSGSSSSNESPYVVNKNENVQLEWQGKSVHTWYDTNVMELKLFSDECFARADVSSTIDTISTYSFSKIEDMISTSIEEPKVTIKDDVVIGSQQFNIGGDGINQQVVTVNWSYENSSTVSTNYGDVVMPAVTIGVPEFVGVNVRQLSEKEVHEGIKGYEVTTRLRQKFSTTDDDDNRTQIVEYEVKHYIIQDIVLKQVGYRKDWEWIDRTDTTALAFLPVVYRDRTYSNGEIFTDTFIGSPHFVNFSSIIGPTEYTAHGGIWGATVYDQGVYENMGNESSSSINVGVVAVSNLSANIIYDGYSTPFPGSWDAYKLQQQFTSDMQVPKDGIEIVGDYESYPKANGWYVFEPEYCRRLCINYANTNDILDLSLYARFTDTYLVIDDFKFSYLEGRNQLEFNFKVQDTSYNGQLAKRYIHEGWTTFFGKEFKASSNALLYQKSTSRASSGDFTQNENIKSIKSVRLNTVPVPYLTSPRFVYGGKPKGVKGRY